MALVVSTRRALPNEAPGGAILGLCLLAALATATATASAQQWPVVNYTTDDGLVGSQLWDVIQDRRGYLWIGASTGFSRWDGVSFINFTAADGLHNHVGRTIVEDAHGNLWFGTQDGVIRYDGCSFVSFRAEQGMGQGVVWDSARDRFGNLWFGTSDEGVSSYDGTRFTTFNTADGLADSFVYAVCADSRDRLWLGYRYAGVSHCDIEAGGRITGCEHLSVANGLGDDSVRAIVEDHEGNLYFATRGGGITRHGLQGELTTFTTRHGLPSDDVYALLVTHDNELAIGTRGDGLSLCDLPDLTSCRTISRRNGLRDSSVHAVLEDRDQVLWIALNNGLSKLMTGKLRSYTEREGLPAAKVYNLLPGPDDEVWIATYGGLVRLQERAGGGAFEVWTERDGLPASTVWRLLRDRRGNLWVGTTSGLCRFQPGVGCVEVVDRASGLPGHQVLSLAESSVGELWIATSGGVARLRYETGELRLRSYTLADGLAASGASCLAADRFGRIWVGSSGQGLTVIDGDQLRVLTTADGLPDNHLTVLRTGRDPTEDAERQILWIGSSGGGLARLSLSAHLETPLSATVYGPEQGCPSVISDVVENDTGQVWIASNRGVVLFDPAAPTAESAVRRHFTRETGLIGSETHAVARDRHGGLWIGTSNGATYYDQRREESFLPPPLTVIEQVTSGQGRTASATFSAATGDDGRWLSERPIVLPWDDNSLHLDFRVLSSRPAELTVQHRLLGFEQQWNSGSGRSFREYTNLDPGAYTFQVRAAGRDRRWGPTAIQQLVIEPAFWQTRWFAAGVVLTVVLSLVAGHRARTSRIHARARQLEEQVAERTDDLRRYARALEEHSHALAEANARIRAAERHKTEFLTNVSHELRTPLNSIIGFAELLRRQDPPAELRQRFLGNIHSSGRHLLQLINNLLDLSKIAAGRMQVQAEPARLGSLLESLCTLMHGYSREREVTVLCRVLSEPPQITTDVAKLRQILLNLLSNAVKFSPAGTTVEVVCRQLEAGDSPLADDSYLLEVRDCGAGIDPADQQVIFEEFRQAGSPLQQAPGTGLGLAIVDRFVRLLGGVVAVESNPGAGTTFRVVLPVECPAESGDGTQDSDNLATADVATGKTVLVLERDRATFADMAAALEAQGCLVVRAEDAAGAARMAQEIMPAVVVADLVPPSFAGWDALIRVAVAVPGRSVVVLLRGADGASGAAVPFDHLLLVSAGDEAVRKLALAACASPGRSLPLLAIAPAAASARLVTRLSAAGIAHSTVETVTAALELIAEQRPGLIVVDLAGPGDGFSAALQLSDAPAARQVPVLALCPQQLTPQARHRLQEVINTAVHEESGYPELIRAVSLLADRHWEDAE